MCSMEMVLPLSNKEWTQAKLDDSENKGINFKDKHLQEDLNKLTDSACESLNESEESGSKYYENISSSEGLDQVENEEEEDSLGCQDDEEILSGEDNDINTLDSESQEINELSSENFEKCKENDERSTINQGYLQEININNYENNSKENEVGDEVSEDSVENAEKIPIHPKTADEFADSLEEDNDEEASNSCHGDENEPAVAVNDHSLGTEVFRTTTPKTKPSKVLKTECPYESPSGVPPGNETGQSGGKKGIVPPNFQGSRSSADSVTLCEKSRKNLVNLDVFLPNECLTEDTKDGHLELSHITETSRKQTDLKKQSTPHSDTPLKSTQCNGNSYHTVISGNISSSDLNPISLQELVQSLDAPLKPSPMAFTVDLGDSKVCDSNGGSGSAGKKLDISDSISRWAPKHRRNLSLTKVEESKKLSERTIDEEPPLSSSRPRSGTLSGSGFSARRGGYHSEGYFSSDQDDESFKRATKDMKSPRSSGTVDVFKPSATRTVDSNSLRIRPPSPVLPPSSPYCLPLNESASLLIEKIINSTPEAKRKQYNKPEGRTYCKERERKPLVSELLTGKCHSNAATEVNKIVNDSKQEVRLVVHADDFERNIDEEEGSETGTYTIDKDSSHEIERARNDIDRIFGVSNESEEEHTSSTTVPGFSTDCTEDEASLRSASEVTPTLSRSSPNWIHQWAAQVAEQTKQHVETSNQSSRLPSQDCHTSGPRKKPPSTTPILGATETDNSDARKHRAGVAANSRGHDYQNSNFESHESGGDSDIDTNTSYPYNDEILPASLRSKLRLTGLHSVTKTFHNPSIVSPRNFEGTFKDPKLMNREANYNLYSARREDIHSDSSSSEVSEPLNKEVTNCRSSSDSNPPLKFNRAFSLRRARLGCDDQVITQNSSDKAKNHPPRYGTSASNRATSSVGVTKVYSFMESSSVSSPRSCGFGSPRGVATSSNTVGASKGIPSSNSFDRTDGGRFSLRMARSVGSTSISSGKVSAAKQMSKKETLSTKKKGHRSNSSLTSKEVDFQNWKRRKNYDPMKAAAAGKKKLVEKKTKDSQLQQEQYQQPSPNGRSPSPVNPLLRSSSFHCPAAPMSNQRCNQNHAPQQCFSEDDAAYSLEETEPRVTPVRGSSSLRFPTNSHEVRCHPSRNLLSTGRQTSLPLSEEVEIQHHQTAPLNKKMSLDETSSERKVFAASQGVPGGSSLGGSSAASGKPKPRMEALDNLVISTIHSLSLKVRSTSESLLQKLKSQYNEEGDRAALLDEVLSHLSESDHSLTSGQTMSTSRELAGILRNLKKIEHALDVIDRVIVVDDVYEDEDLLDEIPQEWVESDY